MSLEPFSLRIQYSGVTGRGIRPPVPSAVHDLKLEAKGTPHILIFSQFQPDRAFRLEPGPTNAIPISKDTASLVKELEGILHNLKFPTWRPLMTDIYDRNIGISWRGPDGFVWRNSAVQGCGGHEPTDVMKKALRATEEDRKAFDRVVEIAEALVKRGVAYDEESTSLGWVNDFVAAAWGARGLVWPET